MNKILTRLNKKGVSPLIATVLLVMIVVSIGASVMVVIQGLAEGQITAIESQQTKLECGSSIDAQVMKIGSEYKMCVNKSDTSTTGTMAFYFENTGIKDISGIKVTVVGEYGVNYSVFDQSEAAVSSGGAGQFRVTFSNVSDDNSGLELIQIDPRFANAGADPVSCKIAEKLEFDEDEIGFLPDCSTVVWDDNNNVQQLPP